MLELTLLCTMIVGSEESCSAGLPDIGDKQFPIVGFTDLCARSFHLVYLSPISVHGCCNYEEILGQGGCS